MTILQLAILAGALVGLGVSLAIVRLVPARPDLAASLKTYSPTVTANAEATTRVDGTGDLRDRLGWWVMNQVPLSIFKVPTKELAILRMPVHRFFADAGLVKRVVRNNPQQATPKAKAQERLKEAAAAAAAGSEAA